MKLCIKGTFRIKQYRNDKLIKDISLPNSLTKRGAIEFMGRLILVANLTDAEGREIGDNINISSTLLGVIPENSFVALDREDRIQYYDFLNVPIPALGDNRQWIGTANDGVDWGEFLVDPNSHPGNIYPRLNQPKPNPFVQEATYTKVFRLTVLTEWRGLFILHNRDAGISQKVEAILASAVLPSKLVIHRNDFVEVSWTLQLSPTFV